MRTARLERRIEHALALTAVVVIVIGVMVILAAQPWL